MFLNQSLKYPPKRWNPVPSWRHLFHAFLAVFLYFSSIVVNHVFILCFANLKISSHFRRSILPTPQFLLFSDGSGSNRNLCQCCQCWKMLKARNKTNCSWESLWLVFWKKVAREAACLTCESWANLFFIALTDCNPSHVGLLAYRAWQLQAKGRMGGYLSLLLENVCTCMYEKLYLTWYIIWPYHLYNIYIYVYTYICKSTYNNE